MNKRIFGGALAGERLRVIVSTDIGGSDADDFQSLVHYLLYADLFDTEGILSSPWGAGRRSDVLRVIDAYQRDWPRLRGEDPRYPDPEYVREIAKQGAVDFAPWKGWSAPTEGSEWIIQCARRPDPRPLYLLMWGLLEDLAQALHDAPDILPRLRVHFIGGPNKKWGANAYAYILNTFPGLWMIEDNSTYRGWFNGGAQEPPWDNAGFVRAFAAGHGALGGFFARQLDGVLKMGDTPTVARLLNGAPERPEGESWGGSFVPVRSMPQSVLRHPVDESVSVEAFSLNEVRLSGPDAPADDAPVFAAEIRGQRFAGYSLGGGEYGFRFVPKETGDFDYRIHSGTAALDGLAGRIHVVPETLAARRTGPLTHWWSDDLDPARAEGPHSGAKTVNRWRRDALGSFAERLERLKDGRSDG